MRSILGRGEITKQTIKNLYDQKIDLFSNINSDNDFDKELSDCIKCMVYCFFRGCFKLSIMSVIGHNVPLSSIDEDEWMEYCTEGALDELNNNFEYYAENFYLTIDDYFVRKSGFNLIYDRKSYKVAKEIVRKYAKEVRR